MKVEGPKPTGRAPITNFALEGAVVPWRACPHDKHTHDCDGEPVLFGMPRTDVLFLACFSNQEKCEAFMKKAGIAFDELKVIDEPIRFIDSVHTRPGVEVMFDPWFTIEGRVRFALVRVAGDGGRQA